MKDEKTCAASWWATESRFLAAMKMREALWSAVACYCFRSGQLAGRHALYRTLGSKGASSPDQSGSPPRRAALERVLLILGLFWSLELDQDDLRLRPHAHRWAPSPRAA